MSDPAQSATLYTQYTSKVDDDLAALENEHAGLVARLAQVERDLDLLRKMKALFASDGDGGQEPAATAGEDRGLEAPSHEPSTTKTVKKAAAKKAAKSTAETPPTDTKKTTAKKTTAKKTAASKTTARAAKEAESAAAGPSNRQLILEYLTEIGEPRSSSEVAKELSSRHEEFNSSIAATREALEALVARHKVERTTQGRSVFYGLANPASGEGTEVVEQTQDGAS
ncbi:hypothetical protein ACFYMW_25785 [Streptomyces sp. NPDC006692]|uniref:hypothetical protein n=1 Tax=unclassified Streptomyces TaxID=2593676 RepID=UPI00343FDB85